MKVFENQKLCVCVKGCLCVWVLERQPERHSCTSGEHIFPVACQQLEKNNKTKHKKHSIKVLKESKSCGYEWRDWCPTALECFPPITLAVQQWFCCELCVWTPLWLFFRQIIIGIVLVSLWKWQNFKGGFILGTFAFLAIPFFLGILFKIHQRGDKVFLVPTSFNNVSNFDIVLQ